MLEQIVRPPSTQGALSSDSLRSLPESMVAPLVDALRGVDHQRLFLLRGDPGTGRREVVAAAATRTEEIGVTVLDLDYEGWSDEQPDGLLAFCDQLVDKRLPSLDTETRTQVRAAAEQVIALPGKSAIKATLISLALATGTPGPVLSGLLTNRPIGRDQTPPNARDLLAEMLDTLERDGATVIHVVDLDSWPLGATRRWLLARARRPDPRHPTLLTLACPPDTDPDALGFYDDQAPTVIDVTPHDRPSLHHWLAETGDADRIAAAIWDRTGGHLGLVATTIEALSRQGLWNQSPEAARQMDTTDADRASLEQALGPSLAEEIDARIDGLPGLHRNVRDFLQLAALCGELIPAEHVLGALGLVEERQSDVLDIIDDQLVGTDVPLLIETDVQHRAFPSISMYRFANPLIRRVLLDASDERARDEQAQSLVAFLEPLLPKVHRAEARLLFAVSEHLAAREVAERYRTLLDIWAPWDEAGQPGELGLQQELGTWLAARNADPDVLWLVANRTRGHWPPTRRALILDCYRAMVSQGDDTSLPDDRRGLFHFLRAEALVQSGRVPDAEADVRLAMSLVIEKEGETSSSLAAVLALLGAVLVHRRAHSEARSVLERSLEIELAHHGTEGHPQVAFAQARLARLHELTGDLSGARTLLETAHATLHQTLGEDHPVARTVAGNLETLGSPAAKRES